MTEATTKVCPKCEGCRYVANDEDMSPWKRWADLPPGSDLAVRMGLVYPVKCPECEGTGRVRPERKEKRL
jgi:hypothetical protein